MSDIPYYRKTENSSGTLVPVSKEIVLAAIPGIQSHIKKMQESQRLKEIEEAVKTKRILVKTPWYRFNTDRPVTREEAIEYVNSKPDNAFGDSVMWHITGKYWADLANCLENAALLVDDGEKLLLDLESANFVAQFQPEKIAKPIQ